MGVETANSLSQSPLWLLMLKTNMATFLGLKCPYPHADFCIESANFGICSILARILIKHVHSSHSYLWGIYQKENR